MSRTQILDGKSITINIPLTTTTGKIRVKNRSMIFEYGLPVATRQNNFTQSNYIEWQIGYDTALDNQKKLAETTLSDLLFTAYNHKTKALYELSEYMFYLIKWGFIHKTALNSLFHEIQGIGDEYLLENHPSCQIKRTHPRKATINGVDFLESKIEYPLLVHRFGAYEIIAEIVVREKQYAIGTQTMLYFCFPITELKADLPLLGRTAESKETAKFVFNKDNFQIISEMIRIFGMLSKSHQFDILAILKLIQTKI